MTTRRLAVVRAVLLAALCGHVVAFAQPLRLAVSRGPVSLPIYVAEAKGLFERAGVAVELQDCSSGRSCFDLLARGQAEVATAAELLMTMESANGSDAAIIATISTSSQHLKLLARRGAGIGSPHDLRGKRIGTVANTSAQYFLDSWFVYHAIDPADASVAFLPPGQLAIALQRREVDAIAVWEPIVSSAASGLGDDAVAMPSPRVYTQHFCLIASRQGLDRRTAELVKLLQAIEQAERFIADKPAEARELLKVRLHGEAGLDKLGEHDFRLTLGQSLIATMDSQARWAARHGQPGAGRPGNLLRYIEPGPLAKAVTGAVELVR